ncbi:MAG: acetyl-CoA carboxylase carboxyltransferase component [Candidatus Poriferisodalaceae bacterium]
MANLDSSSTFLNRSGKRQLSDDPRQQIIDARIDALAGAASARRRITEVVDPSSFTEYGQLAGRTSDVDDDSPADGLVCGVAEITAQPVAIAAYDATVASGTQSERNQRKLAKLIYLSMTNRWPLILLIEGAGARPDDPLKPPPIVQYTRARWDVLDGLAELSGWAPTIAVFTAEALDGHVAVGMMTDISIAIAGTHIGSRSSGTVTLRAVEDHAARGDIDIIANNEGEAWQAVRTIVDAWHDVPTSGDQSEQHDGIRQIVPDNRRRPYDMRKLIVAVADADGLLELGKDNARSMITCLARLDGRPVGIFANQPFSPRAGAIDSVAADKAARFVELCDAYEFPLVSLVDNPGYMVGPDAEREGIARHHARPLSAIHHRTVPLYTVQIRKAYGLGPFAMSGYGSSRGMPELRLSWPSVESAGMSLEGAAYLVKRKEIQAAANPQEARAIRDDYAEDMRDVASGVRAGRTYSFDDVVLPEETRDRIIAMLRRHPSRSLTSPKKHPIDPR